MLYLVSVDKSSLEALFKNVNVINLIETRGLVPTRRLEIDQFIQLWNLRRFILLYETTAMGRVIMEALWLI